MGGGIGQWLLFRSHDRSLCLFSLVVPPGAMTPIHDHLAWGIIGLYRGNQDEEFYHPGNGTIGRGDGGRSTPATTTSSSLRPTTFTACGRRRSRPPSRSTCLPTIRGASSATPSTRPRVRHGRSCPATSTRSARQSRRRTARKGFARRDPMRIVIADDRCPSPRGLSPSRSRTTGTRSSTSSPTPTRAWPRSCTTALTWLSSTSACLPPTPTRGSRACAGHSRAASGDGACSSSAAPRARVRAAGSSSRGPKGRLPDEERVGRVQQLLDAGERRAAPPDSGGSIRMAALTARERENREAGRPHPAGSRSERGRPSAGAPDSASARARGDELLQPRARRGPRHRSPTTPSVPATTSPVLTPIRPSIRERRERIPASPTAARHARSASSSCAAGTPKTAITASPMNFSTAPPCHSTIAFIRSK